MPIASDYIQLSDGRWVLKQTATSPTLKPTLSSDTVPSGPTMSGDTLLDWISAFIRRFVVLLNSQLVAVSLWVVHTHALESAEVTPYLNIYSPEKRSGKTRLLEVAERIVMKPWFTGRVSGAVLARKVDAECPTLLLDESDAAFNSDKQYSETLRGMLNTGYRRGGKISICVGQGIKIGYRDLSTFCPKAIAGIGKLPDTVADRSIPIILKRRAPSEKMERFHIGTCEEEACLIKTTIKQWLNTMSLTKEPELPPELDDRAADCWEPLLAIADAAGGDWPIKARRVAVELMTGKSREEQSRGVRLLSDIRRIFNISEIKSADLVDALLQIEEAPWGDINGKPLNTRSLAHFLKPYDISPQTIRFGTSTPKAYRQVDFHDAWLRYLPTEACESETSATLDSPQAQEDTLLYPQQSTLKQPNVADLSQAQVSLNVADVADKKPNETENTEIKGEWQAEI